MSLFYDDMNVGREFTSGSRSIGREEIEAFARLTGDMNRLHTDESYARTTIFRGVVAHGLLVLSIALGLWYETGLTRDSLVALLGVNKVAFKAPARPGEQLRLLTKVQSRRLSDSPSLMNSAPFPFFTKPTSSYSMISFIVKAS